VSVESAIPQAPIADNVHDDIIDMLFSLATLAAAAKQTALAARIRDAADSSVVFL
jgi:hypothetical protein